MEKRKIMSMLDFMGRDNTGLNPESVRENYSFTMKLIKQKLTEEGYEFVPQDKLPTHLQKRYELGEEFVYIKTMINVL